jgi:hypothetical protein
VDETREPKKLFDKQRNLAIIPAQIFREIMINTTIAVFGATSKCTAPATTSQQLSSSHYISQRAFTDEIQGDGLLTEKSLRNLQHGISSQ